MSLGVKEFLELVNNKLAELEEKLVFSKPTESSEFPCREINTPLKSVNKTHALETFQISIKHWNENQKSAMEMADKTDEKLLEYNLVRISTNQCTLDEILQKYQLTSTYEVKYNALTNAFQLIK